MISGRVIHRGTNNRSRHNATVPRTIAVAGDTPVTVETAARVFSSTLRLHLIRHFMAAPGSQRNAVDALEVAPSSVSTNIRALVAAGVLIEEPHQDRRLANYRVDVERVEELLEATRSFTLEPPAGPSCTPPPTPPVDASIGP